VVSSPVWPTPSSIRLRRRWVFEEDTFDLDVRGCQDVLGHDVGQHDEAVNGKARQLIS
jgi:hypothetical protein